MNEVSKRMNQELAMNSTGGTMRLGKVMEIVIWIAGLGVLAANVLLLRQNRSLQDTLAPQIAAGARFEKLAGLTLDGRFQPVPTENAIRRECL